MIFRDRHPLSSHNMTLSRRHFLGASLALSTGLVASGVLAAPRASAQIATGSRPPLLPQALAALDRHGARITYRDLIGIADFSSHSRETRFHMVDVASGRIRNSLLVAHGRGSDPVNTGFVQKFSNRPGSNASSEGSFLTGDAYVGRHGRSRRLHGLEPQNNLAFERAIVIHGADYVDMRMALQQGRVGRSQGCFAVDQRDIDNVLRQLGPGRLLFAAQ
jgi:hypothetical protein